jgi:DNA-binding SARP family transcriptional activator
MLVGTVYRAARDRGQPAPDRQSRYALPSEVVKFVLIIERCVECTMEFGLLGHLEVTDGGAPVEIRGYKPRSLLAVLLVSANQAVTVERLVDALWGDQPPSTARATVQYFVHKLRQALGGGASVITTEPGGYRIQVDPDALDLMRFTTLVRSARLARAAGDVQVAAAD